MEKPGAHLADHRGVKRLAKVRKGCAKGCYLRALNALIDFLGILGTLWREATRKRGRSKKETG
jgi:hypothetical protein